MFVAEKGEASGPVKRIGRGRALVVLTAAILIAALGAAVVLRPGAPPAPGPAAPPSPGGLRGTAGDAQATLAWDVVAGADGYNVYRASSPGVTKDSHGSLPDGARFADVVSPYTIAGLVNDRVYYFRVTAFNEAGESDVSEEVSVTPEGIPPLAAPAAPTNVEALAGDARVPVSWDPVPGADAYHLFRASEPGVTKTGYASMPDGARYADVASPYTLAGLVIGRTYYVRVTAENAAGESDESAEASATPVGPLPGTELFVAGLVEFDSGAPVPGATVLLRTEDSAATATGTTGADGWFNIGLRALLPVRVLAEVRYESADQPPVTGFRWSPEVSTGGAVVVSRLALPDPSTKRLVMAGSTARSVDDAVVAESLPGNVAAVWARPYDPDAAPDVFPGDLAERRDYPLNSVVFLWVAAMDASGLPVFDAEPPATVRMRVPTTQWVDAEDLQPGNGVIDTPIYSLDYATAYWIREPNGRLTDADGAPIAEAYEQDIRSGLYAGEVYAQFQATHFSWWNVDTRPWDCGPDFGDADDPPYPSRLASDGVRHLNICRAWLGAWVDAEDDADAVDTYDDGLRGRDPLEVRVSNFDWSGDLYLNALIDANSDGDWADADEWAVENLLVRIPRYTGKVVETDVVWDGDTWLRLTLTGSPITDYDGTGEFEIGETEDYPFLKYRLSLGVVGNGTVNSVPPGIDCRSTGRICSAEFSPETLVTLTATPDAGLLFVGWGLDCSGANATCEVRMDGHHVVLAVFTVPSYRLSVWVSGAGNVRSVPAGIDCRWGYPGCSAEFPAGSLVDLVATPDAGWRFDRWGGDCSGTGAACVVQMDRMRFVFANFTKSQYGLSVWVVGNGTVTSDSPGIDCRYASGTCFVEFPAGSVVNLTATPDAGESLVGWGGDCSGLNATCTVGMDRDRFVAATFTSPYYQLFVSVYSSDPGGNYSGSGGTVTSAPPGIDCRDNGTSGGNCSAFFLAGTNVTLTATSNPGWRFVGWSGDCTGTSPTCWVTMNEQKWVFAYFEKI
ncbi:MAG TPA: fibronectin type III domain-containing protein [Thermoplasmata archaeon]|nr:fibronectin type III domain-containing protein [Thermoplasmata archaeon]